MHDENAAFLTAESPPLGVLILSLEYGPEISGGVGTHAEELARGLATAGHRVTVVAFTKGASRVLEPVPGLEVHLLSLGAEALGTSREMSVTRSVLALNDELGRRGRRLIEEASRPDIVQCYNWVTWPAGRELAEDYDLPAISTLQYVSDPVERWWGQEPDPEVLEQERRLFEQGDVFLTVSRSMARLIAGRYGLEEDRLRVVYNALDADAFAAPAAPEAIDRLRRAVAGDARRVVLFVGRLNAMKGIGPLVESAARVVERRPDVRYLLVGEADSRHYSAEIDRDIARHPALKPRIKRLGKLPRKQVALLLRVADLMVTPSIYEPFGYVALEALAAGTPVVASRTGGLQEIVEHEGTGLLVPLAPVGGSRDEPSEGARTGEGSAERRTVPAEALADAQLRLLDDPDLLARCAEAGPARARLHFSLQGMVDGSVAGYRQAIVRHLARLERPSRRNPRPAVAQRS